MNRPTASRRFHRGSRYQAKIVCGAVSSSGDFLAMVIVMALLAAGLVPANGQRDPDPRFPAFDPADHEAPEVVQALRDNLFVRLRMHYDEEALVVALETAARFNGKLSPRDQARLDELVARCFMVNRSEWDQARALLERADQARSDNGLHEAAIYTHEGLLTDNLSTRVRLPLWAAECAVEAGDYDEAASIFRQAADADLDLFGGDFQAMLAAAERSVRAQGPPSLDAVGLLDVSYWRFWDDLAAWSRLITGAVRSGSAEILKETELALRVEAIVASGLIRMESYAETTEYRFHTVGRGCLDYFLDVVVAYAESRPRQAGDGPALARQVLDQLEEMEEGHVFARQPARLLRLDISHRGLADNGDITRLMNLLRKAELWRESRIYGLVVSALAEGQQPEALGEAVLYGKHLSISRLARELDRAQRAGRQPYRRYEEAYGTWVDHRLRFGYAHPATIDWWDAAGDLLWDLSEPDGASSLDRSKDEGALYPMLSEGTVAIEFVRVPSLSFVSGEGWRDTDGNFVAVVFNADRTVRVVPLGMQSEVTQAVEAFRTTMMPYQARTSTPEQRSAAAASAVAILSEQILAPLMNGSREVREAGTWVVGLEGALEMMPLFALLWEGRELGLTKTVIHVSQVAGWQPRSPTGGERKKSRALLVGRPDYTEANLAAPQTIAGARSLDLGTEFGDLPGTGIEVEDLEKLFQEQGIACTVQTGVLASERGLRSAATDHSIIHLATHGYYLPDEGSGAAPTDLSEADALFRSAVVLSGVNRTLQ
ncbi:MAG: CHAT domain-containing protein, partial [Verrucomicrobiota bacterium]